MAIVFSCACGQKYSVAESLAGKSGRCKKCGATMAIPRVAAEAAEAPEIAPEEDPTRVAVTVRPAEPVAGAAPEPHGPEGPAWFEGYLFPSNRPRDCRVYRVGDELLLLDVGARVGDSQQAAVRVGASAGGLVGGLVGLAVGAVLKKVDEAKQEKAERRRHELDNMSPAKLLREADAGRPSRRWPRAAVTGATLRSPSLWEAPEVAGVLDLRTADGRKTEKTLVYFDRLKDVKDAAALLRAALGEENVTVQVPLKRKAHASAEARRRRNKKILEWSLVGGIFAGIGLLVLIALLLGRSGHTGGGRTSTGAPDQAPEGFAVVDTPGDAPPPNPDLAQRTEQRRLAKRLADEAPPFDPAHPPTMRSTFGHLAALGGVGEEWVEACEKRLNGEPIPANLDAKYVDYFLRGQGAPAREAGHEAPRGAWDPIPIDEPSAPFKAVLPTGIPLEAHPGGAFHPGVMNGPFFIPYPWWLQFRAGPPTFDLAHDPKHRGRYVEKIKAPYPSHPVIDLRSGQTVGEFDWRAPVWANARLSPDGAFLAGTDTFTTLQLILTSTVSGWENGKDLLFIWARGKKSPATLKVPGPVDWMEFVSNDRLAYVTYAPAPVLRVHDVTKNQQVAEIELAGAGPAAYPDRQHDETPVYSGLEFYRPMARRGAVSAGGKYVALGCRDGVRLVSVAEGKVVGLLPVADTKWYRWLNFSPDGARLFGFVVAGTRYGDLCSFRSWSVETGRPLDELQVDPYVTGPIYPGPVDGLYVANKFFFTKVRLPLDDAPFRIVRLEHDGTALVIAPRAQAPPDTPPCRSLQERIKAKQAPPAEADRKDIQFALFTSKLDWSKAVEKVKPIVALLVPRPPAGPGDRAGVVAQKPQAPEAWTPPPFAAAPAVPAEGDDPAAMHQFAVWPVSFGDDRAAVVRYVPKAQYRKRWEVWLDLLDRTTGKRAAPAAKLWDWAFLPEEAGSGGDEVANPGTMGPAPLPAVAALRPDAGLFALVDPNDPRRVDVFESTGERVLGLVPYADRRIDWLGWTRTHLLTVGEGRLTAWDPSSGKALFEVEGGYTHAGAVSPDRRWVVLWTGKHADVLDTATGKCLGRCQAGGFSGRLEAFTLSPDGRRLAAAFTGWPTALALNGPGYTAVVWNLETGKAGLYGFVGDGDRPRAAPMCTWAGTEHLLLSGHPLTEPATLMDTRLGVPVGSFKIEGGGYVPGRPALGTPDGRVWYATSALAGAPPGFNPNVAPHPDFPAAFAWHTVSLPGLHGEDAFLADPGREWVEPAGQPVQVQASFGTKAQSEALARAVARTLQARGLLVGPGGTVLRVEGKLEETQEVITSPFGGEAKIPRAVLSARWLSGQGAELWKGTTAWTWSMAATKYKVSEKREGFGPMGSEQRFEFDFQGRSPSSAMREELVEGLGDRVGTGWLQLPEPQFLRVQGRDRPVPVAGPMRVRMPRDAK